MIGHRGMYKDGWSASTIRQPETVFSEEHWELHDLRNDPTESVDLSEKYPEKVESMKNLWEETAWENQVFPLDEGNNVKNILRPPWNEKLVQEMVLYPGTPTVERWKSQQLISFRNWSVEVQLDYKKADQGTLFAHGDQGGGYALYVMDGTLLFSHNGYGEMTNIQCGEMPEGHNTIVITVTPPDFLHWDVEISLNGTTMATHTGLLALLAMAPFQGIDIGIDSKSPVNWEVYEKYRNFSYTGSLETVRYLPGDLTDFAGSKWIDFLKQEGKRFE